MPPTRAGFTLSFDPKIIEQAKAFADEQGLPLSRWIEQLIRRELKRLELEQPGKAPD